MKSIPWFFVLIGAAFAQDDPEFVVEPFEFGTKAPMKQLPELEVWHIPGNLGQSNGTGYFTYDCWSHDGRYIRHSDSNKYKRVIDFHRLEVVKLPKAEGMTWRTRENTIVFARGGVLQMMKLEKEPTFTVINQSVEGRFGNVDCNDEYVYLWDTPDGVLRYPLKAGGVKELCKMPKGSKVEANPFYPAVNVKRADGKNPLGVGGMWTNLDGSEQHWMNPGMMRHHSSWLGNGEYFILGDGPIRGRKWNEPYPSNVHLLSAVHAGDFGSLGASGRWTVGGGNGGRGAIRGVDLRSGDMLFEFWPFSAQASLADRKPNSNDAQPKGSPDGTKFLFGSTVDLTTIPSAFVVSDPRGTTVEVTSTEGFPESGFIARSAEGLNGCAVAEYQSKTPTSFEGVTLGALGSHGRKLRTGDWITPWEPRLLPKKGEPLKNQRRLQNYLAIARQPDAPWLRETSAGFELIPGENHRETHGYFFFRDGEKLNQEPILPGATFPATSPGTYTASAIEWFGLKSQPSGSVKLSAPGEIQILEATPDDFSWTTHRWIVEGQKAANETAALSATSATRQTLHRIDGLIVTAAFEDGQMVSHFDLNKDGKAIRRCFYQSDQLVKREYHTPEGQLDARELFNTNGFIIEQSWGYHGGETPDMHWFYEHGTPIKLITKRSSSRFSKQGPGTYEKLGEEWIQVSKPKPQ
ncbi:MAG: hypothetical protein AAGH89_06500 [Verrucomicrobiota bacterium]